ncbi:capon-like protein isoform X1 [Zophobas morio]|uniref:capon-like protein isoform X1 n=1 Tax=Zophobas morio TaxID=2755281 RepID=UPI0030835684
MSKKAKMVRARHSSIDMPDPEVVVKKKQDMLTKARNKLMNLGDVLKTGKNVDGEHHKKPVTHAIDYIFKHCPKEKNHVYSNSHTKKNALQKQNSVGSYPIKIEITQDSDEERESAQRSRPATVCVDKMSECRETAALALERPRKKLSFREPEIVGRTLKPHDWKPGDKGPEPELRRSSSYCNGILHRTPSFEDSDLESQAMRVVRTIGQAFEVCHKLSITAPENEAQDQDEQDTLTQDLLSDRLSDITDKPKKDLLFEGASDKMSLPPDDSSLRDSYPDAKSCKPQQLDILPPPPTTNTRKSPLTSAETYSSPHSDVLTSGSGSGGSNSLPPPGSALSAHHELQLLREQLDQQSQQTQAALAQLQLAREQLAAEQSARLEAQARTHQLLIHNRELLDHIAALVSHLQGGEKSGQQPTPPHVTMPQQQQPPGSGDAYGSEHLSETASLDNSPAFQALGLNPQGLIENRAVTSCLPPSPLRTNYNPAGTVFNFSYPPPMDAGFDSQLLQRLQSMGGYSNPSPYAYNYQTLPFLSGLYGQPLINNNYTLQPPPQKKMASSPMGLRHSYAGTSPVMERRLSPGRNVESQYSPAAQYSPPQGNHLQVQGNTQGNHLQVQQNVHQRQPSPDRRDSQFIKPLSQMGTLTTTDSEGRVRVIVPVPSGGADDAGNMLANLRLSDTLRVSDDLRTLNGPAITRSTSEKVPNRSELMSQVQRTMWARHTTK